MCYPAREMRGERCVSREMYSRRVHGKIAGSWNPRGRGENTENGARARREKAAQEGLAKMGRDTGGENCMS